MSGHDYISSNVFEKYEFLAQIGQGSYGAVYKARCNDDDMLVAIKVLNAGQEETLEIQKETDILKVCDSPYIVRYKGTHSQDQKLFIVMEYCGVGSLSDLMAICETTLSESQIAAVMKQSLKGLAYLHANRKIHRDIKSGNILLTEIGECKLADFGVSAELTSTLAKRATMIGTPYFMAPEVLRSSEYDATADIWSIGITAYELAIGAPPHADVHPMRAIFVIPSSPPPTLPEPNQFSYEFKDFLSKCLQKDPAHRLSAKSLLEHPFIKNSAETEVIQDLVNKCRENIQEYRDVDQSMQIQSGENIPQLNTDTIVNGGATEDGTIIAPSLIFNYNDQTAVRAASNLRDVANNSGTVVRNPSGTNNYGTVINHDNNNYSYGDQDNYGTVVFRKDDAHFGTIKMLNKNSTVDKFDQGTIVKSTQNFSSADSGSAVATLPLNTNLAHQISLMALLSNDKKLLPKAMADVNELFEKDVAMVEKFYKETLETMRIMADRRK